MPTLSVNKSQLFEKLGKEFSDEEFADLCFQFGIELDDIEIEIINNIKTTVYKIDIPANRYDLLCLEGLSRALRVFLEIEESPKFTSKNSEIIMKVKNETKQIRPFIVCAILRNIKFTNESIQRFMDLQDKLHHNICRKRSLVAIGTHDLDTLKPPFSYEALPPEDIKFIPLGMNNEVNSIELMEIYENHPKLKEFLNIIRESPVYPIIYDSNRTVLSLPPIINGEHSKLTINTKNVFIECTAIDFTKANIVLNTIVAMFSEYCEEKFSCETIKIISENEEDFRITPNLSKIQFKVNSNYIRNLIGINSDNLTISRLLKRMMLEVNFEEEEEDILNVKVPITRSDILHACDIAEDVGISYGFNKIIKTRPKSNTLGRENSLNKLTEMIRESLAQCGYLEVLSFALSSLYDCYEGLNRKEDGKAAIIMNPKTKSFQIIRTTLLGGLLRTAENSKSEKLPISMFEVSDVVLLNENDIAENCRKASVLRIGTTDQFEYVHGCLNQLMSSLGIKWDVTRNDFNSYYLKNEDSKTFLPGKSASIWYNHKKIGILGVLHPLILSNFGLVNPCTVFEINIEPFL